MSGKKICFVLPVHSSFTMGGSQYQADILIKDLLERNCHAVSYITNRFNPEKNDHQYEIVELPSNKYFRNGMISLASNAIRLYRVLKKIQPDVIYQRVGCYMTGVCAYYAKKYGCNMIWHVASDYDVNPLGFQIARNILTKLSDKKIQEYGLKNATHIIAQTNHQARDIEKNYHRKVDEVVYNFHPLPEGKEAKKGDIRVVWIANLKKNKRPEIFIRLANDLHEKTGATFVMAGKRQGGKKWWKTIESDIGKTRGLEYLGPVPQEEVNELIEKSHILVNTSVFEGFSNTFIQAWMRNVPVVSINVDPDELLSSKQIGMVSKSYEQLKQDVHLLIERQDLREKMGNTAYEYSAVNHSLSNIRKIYKIMQAQK